MMVTSDPEVAAYAVDSGVDRIFVDLETRGKSERQQGLGMFLSRAQLDDVARVREAVPPGRLLVRINGTWEHTIEEVTAVVESGADLIMVPMFTQASEIEAVCAAAGGAPVIPLFETAESVLVARQVMALPGVAEGYVGLNDLALSFGQSFLFRAMLDDRFGRLCGSLQMSGKPFGIGGIGRIGSGQVPADLLLGEYMRRGASRVILSRAFRDGAEGINGIREAVDLKAEVDRARSEAARIQNRSQADADDDTRQLVAAIAAVP